MIKVLWVMIILTHLTVIQRIYHVRGDSLENEDEGDV
jgi:hypothetical protein